MVRAEDFDSSIVGSNPATPASKIAKSLRLGYFAFMRSIGFRPSAARRVGSVSPLEDRQARLPGAERANFRHRRIPSLTDRRGRRSLQKKILAIGRKLCASQMRFFSFPGRGSIGFRPSAARRVGSVSPLEDRQARLPGAERANFRHRRISGSTDRRGRRSLQIKNYLQNIDVTAFWTDSD